MHDALVSLSPDFNPRPRKEGDIKNRGKKQQNSYFNPRPRKEGDFSIIFCVSSYSDFNPRPRKEGDNTIVTCHDIFINFNPRPRKEGDLQRGYIFYHRCEISIHALVKRATF